MNNLISKNRGMTLNLNLDRMERPFRINNTLKYHPSSSKRDETYNPWNSIDSKFGKNSAIKSSKFYNDYINSCNIANLLSNIDLTNVKANYHNVTMNYYDYKTTPFFLRGGSKTNDEFADIDLNMIKLAKKKNKLKNNKKPTGEASTKMLAETLPPDNQKGKNNPFKKLIPTNLDLGDGFKDIAPKSKIYNTINVTYNCDDNLADLLDKDSIGNLSWDIKAVADVFAKILNPFFCRPGIKNSDCIIYYNKFINLFTCGFKDLLDIGNSFFDVLAFLGARKDMIAKLKGNKGNKELKEAIRSMGITLVKDAINEKYTEDNYRNDLKNNHEKFAKTYGASLDRCIWSTSAVTKAVGVGAIHAILRGSTQDLDKIKNLETDVVDANVLASFCLYYYSKLDNVKIGQFAKMIHSSKVGLIDWSFLSHVKIPNNNSPLQARIELGIAGYRMLSVFALVSPDVEKLTECQYFAILILRELYSKPVNWDIAAVSRANWLKGLIPSLNKSCGDLMSRVYVNDTLKMLITKKFIFDENSYKRGDKSWESWGNEVSLKKVIDQKVNNIIEGLYVERPLTGTIRSQGNQTDYFSYSLTDFKIKYEGNYIDLRTQESKENQTSLLFSNISRQPEINEASDDDSSTNSEIEDDFSENVRVTIDIIKVYFRDNKRVDIADLSSVIMKIGEGARDIDKLILRFIRDSYTGDKHGFLSIIQSLASADGGTNKSIKEIISGTIMKQSNTKDVVERKLVNKSLRLFRLDHIIPTERSTVDIDLLNEIIIKSLTDVQVHLLILYCIMLFSPNHNDIAEVTNILYEHGFTENDCQIVFCFCNTILNGIRLD